MSDVTRIQNAVQMATYYHRNQKRKYSGEPYFVHLAEVASLVAMITPDSRVIATAYLHDVLEDTEGTKEAIELACGRDVADWVVLLTDSPLEFGNRAKRKAADIERLAAAPVEVQNIKCCDSISNTKSIRQWDRDFWVTYSREKLALLPRLEKADSGLRALALSMAAK